MLKVISAWQCSAFLSCCLVATSVLAGSDDGRLDIYWIDVEGGAATLIVTPMGESILIDTGHPKSRYVDRMHDCIVDVAGLKRLNHLVISHYDSDHYGGAAGLASQISIGNVYDNGKFDGMRKQPDETYWTFPCQQRIVLDPGDEIRLRQLDHSNSTPIRLRCIATRQQFMSPPSGTKQNETDCSSVPMREPDSSENANSMVLVLEYGDFRFFDATDLTWNLESKLVCPVNLIGEVDVYQVTHHGLDRSNNPLVLRSLMPTVSVMNNGRTKGCAPEVFSNLKSTASIQAMYQVHKNRRPDDRIHNTADEFIANVAEGDSGNYIKLSVAPDGSSYKVCIPATGHAVTYDTRTKK